MLSALNLFLYKFPDQRCLCNEIVSDWRENLYTQKAAGLILYGRALGLSHGEAEDVLQETFLALLQKPEPPVRRSNIIACAVSGTARGITGAPCGGG